MRKIKSNLITLILLCPVVWMFAQNVQWISWDQMVEKSKMEKKKIIVDIFTDGCLPCKNMDLTTFANNQVANTMNNCYYAVKFDAKQRKEMQYKEKSYDYNCDYGTCFHSLAFELTSGQLSFPSVVFLDENFNIVQQLPNYQEAVYFHNVMGWVCQNYYKKMPFKTYEGIIKNKNKR